MSRKIDIANGVTEEKLQEFFNRRGKRLARKPMQVGFVKHGLVTAYCPVMGSEFSANDYSQMLDICLDRHDEDEINDCLELGIVKEKTNA